MAPKARPASERFYGKYRIDMETGCWVWHSNINSAGYGQMSERTENGTRRAVYAHRVSYEMHHGPIPDGLVVDHICNNRRCVNPEHLQALTHRQNILRGSAPHVIVYWTNRCLRGHDLSDPDNVYIRPDNGRRMCRECVRIRQRGEHKLKATSG